MPDQAKLIVDELLEVEMIWKAATYEKNKVMSQTSINKNTKGDMNMEMFWHILRLNS